MNNTTATRWMLLEIFPHPADAAYFLAAFPYVDRRAGIRYQQLFSRIRETKSD